MKKILNGFVEKINLNHFFFLKLSNSFLPRSDMQLLHLNLYALSIAKNEVVSINIITP
jgi:hypothetical protein